MVYSDFNVQQFIGNWLWHKPVTTGDFTVSYHLGWGTGRQMSADRDALPQPGSDLGSDYCSSLPYSFSATICGTPVNVNYIYGLITLATLVAHPKLGLIWFMNQHWNLLWSTLDNNPNPSRFSHILSKGPSTSFYTISPWSITILVVLFDNYFDFGFLIQHTWLSTGLYMLSLKELCANWVSNDAPSRGRPRRPANMSHENPMTTEHVTS